MAVGTHLGIAVTEYDERIRTFVPHYEEMLDIAAEALRLIPAASPLIVELGTGSGALAARVLATRSRARVIGIDEDGAMLGMAAARMSNSRRVELRQGNFARLELPRCDGVVASLALHHVKSTARKGQLYGRIARALRPGGLFVNADCAPPADPLLAARAMKGWRAHLEGTYSGREAAGYLRAWAKEDRYLTLDVERDLMARAGLLVDAVWRRDAFVVLVGRKPGARLTPSASRARPSARRR
jgi:tRNA (cmo5U34)-methyltransferase